MYGISNKQNVTSGFPQGFLRTYKIKSFKCPPLSAEQLTVNFGMMWGAGF